MKTNESAENYLETIPVSYTHLVPVLSNTIVVAFAAASIYFPPFTVILCAPASRIADSTEIGIASLSADELLRMAACLEEHFPHSMAKAVVEAEMCIRDRLETGRELRWKRKKENVRRIRM